jgi:hypothetical protein
VIFSLKEEILMLPADSKDGDVGPEDYPKRDTGAPWASVLQTRDLFAR